MSRMDLLLQAALLYPHKHKLPPLNWQNIAAFNKDFELFTNFRPVEAVDETVIEREKHATDTAEDITTDMKSKRLLKESTNKHHVSFLWEF